MKIILTDINPLIVNAWKIQNIDNEIEIHNSDFKILSADAIVSPANSFAIMDGGVDQALLDEFGYDIQQKIRNRATALHNMPIIPVGASVAIDIKHKQYKWLISAPTMPVPMDVSNTFNAYISTRSALSTAKTINAKSVLLFGMGALTGNYNPEICAAQMMLAISDFQSNKEYKTWDEVNSFIRKLCI